MSRFEARGHVSHDEHSNGEYRQFDDGGPGSSISTAGTSQGVFGAMLSSQSRLLSVFRRFSIFMCVLLVTWPFGFFMYRVLRQNLEWPDSDDSALSFSLYFLIYTIYVISVTSWSFTRRHLYPFKQMSYVLVFISTVAAYMLFAWVALYEGMSPAYPCGIARWISGLGYPAMMIPFLIRAWRLHVIFNSHPDPSFVSPRNRINQQYSQYSGPRTPTHSAITNSNSQNHVHLGSSNNINSNSNSTSQLRLPSPVSASGSSPRSPAAPVTPIMVSHDYDNMAVLANHHINDGTTAAALMSSSAANASSPSFADADLPANHATTNGRSNKSTGSSTPTSSSSGTHNSSASASIASLRVSSASSQSSFVPTTDVLIEPSAISWKHQLTDARLFVIFCLCMLPFVVIGILTAEFDTWWILDFSCYPDEVADTPLSHILWVLLNVAEVCLFGVLLYYLRGIWDAFDIRSEIRGVFFCEALFCLLHVIGIVFGISGTDDPSRYLVCSRSALFFYLSIAQPLYQTYGSQLPMVPPTDSPYSLSDILSDPECFTFFSDFMNTDPDGQLLEFYIQVELFRDKVNPVHRCLKARHIYDRYLSNHSQSGFDRNFASLATRISSGDKQRLHNKIMTVVKRGEETGKNVTANLRGPAYDHDDGTTLPESLFDAAQQVAFQMMQQSCFPRFLKSETYTLMRHAIDKQRSIHGRLLMSSMIVPGGVGTGNGDADGK